MSIENKLHICKETRKIAVETLTSTLKDLISKSKSFSEVALRDQWLEKMRKSKDIFPDGWYIPPPHGIGALFATDDDIDRVCPDSLRPQENWPRNDIYLDVENGIIMLYASPVNKDYGIIGDFGLTLYLGKKPEIIEHLEKAFHLVQEIFEYIETGMKFSDIARCAHQQMNEQGLYSDLLSPTDPAGTNIGHTIPAVFEGWNDHEDKIIKSTDSTWDEVKKVISKKRIFVNEIESLTVKPGMAFTIEPRPKIVNNPNIPMVWFHTIVIINKEGKKELVTGFDELFKLTGMDYMLP